MRQASRKLRAPHLAETMVVNGYAVPYAEYSDAYVPQGDAASEGEVGIWNTTFQMPWDFRKAH